jgi:ribosomal protein S18 acetylase RimI-like enzyme
MNIHQVFERKKDYIDLLLLADEQENMVDKYLERGDMFVLEDNGVKAECVVTKEADGVYELKNIAVTPDYQRRGYGKKLIEFLLFHYTDWKVFLVGTGDSENVLNFYKSCGFKESHRIKNFFTDNYNHPMYENEKQLIDMIYLRLERKKSHQLLRSPDIQLTRDVIAEALGGANEAYVKFCNELASRKITLEWRYYNDGKAWLAKGIYKWTGVRGGPKYMTVFWLSIWEGFFKVTLYFPEKVRDDVLQLPIEETVKERIPHSSSLGKLQFFPIVFDFFAEDHFETLFTLVEFKKILK